MSLKHPDGWPDPFARWGEGPLAITRIPLTFVSRARTPVASAVLQLLIDAALRWDRNPNDRCAILTVAAALVIAPEEVFLAPAARPFFPGMRDLPEDDGLPASCAGVNASLSDWLEGDALDRAVTVRYQSLRATLRISTDPALCDWLATPHQPDLAVHYTDHDNDLFAVGILRRFLPDWPDDHARLKLMAMALDAVKRSLDCRYPYWEDLPHWLGGGHSYAVVNPPRDMQKPG